MGAQNEDAALPNYDSLAREPEAGSPGEGPVHEVALPAYYLSKYETTTGQWARLTGRGSRMREDDLLPVSNVSWADCSALAARFELLLPTEAQWEYGCRAGTSTPFWFGEHGGDLPEVGWYSYNSSEAPHPIGQKRANAWGLHDVHGNLWEWCGDWAEDYAAAPGGDSAPSPGSSLRVFRGGAFASTAAWCRAATRKAWPPGDRYSGLGFRVAIPAAR